MVKNENGRKRKKAGRKTTRKAKRDSHSTYTSRNQVSENNHLKGAAESEASLLKPVPLSHRAREPKMSLRREAIMTSHSGSSNKGFLRNFPVTFVKSTEIYDPNKALVPELRVEGSNDVDSRYKSSDEKELQNETTSESLTDQTEEMTPSLPTAASDVISVEEIDLTTEVDEDEEDDVNDVNGVDGEDGTPRPNPDIPYFVDTEGDRALAAHTSFTGEVYSWRSKENEWSNGEDEDLASTYSRFRVIDDSIITTRPRDDSQLDFSVDTAGVADDEDNDSSETEMTNHSSDLDYEQLIGLRRLALRDLDLGDSHGTDSNSVNDADWSSNDDSDESDGEQNGIISLEGLKRITKTFYASEGKIFNLEWDSEIEPVPTATIGYDTLRRTYASLGFSESEILESIRLLGGSVSSGEEDAERSDLDEMVVYNKHSYDTSADELDQIIRDLIDEGTGGSQKRLLDAVAEKHSPSVPAPSKRKGKNKVPHFYVSDDETREYLEKQWLRSREAKKLRKKQREEQHRNGALKTKKTSEYVYDLTDLFPRQISVSEVVDHIKTFIDQEETTIIFPPMDKNARWIVKSLCEAFFLSPQSRGDGLTKRVFATRTSNSHGMFNSRVVNSLLNRRRIFPRTDVSKSRIETTLPKRSGGPQHHREGDVVGATAGELAEDNIGRLMLERMGWKTGTGLGAANVGITEPIAAKVKRSKWGLGTGP